MRPETQEWLEIAESDHKSSQVLFDSKLYPQAVYFICQAVEKVLKAVQVENTNQIPKKTHDLENLAIKANIKLIGEQNQALKELAQHYRRVRYPDYRRVLYSTRLKVEPILSQGKEMYQWILTRLNNR